MKSIRESLIIPKGYKSSLNIKETEIAIKKVKDFFESELSKALKLTRVSAPLFVCPETGMNDNLNGVERPVSFDIKDIEGQHVEIVHSLAKWKRMALGRYGFEVGEGLYTDMDAIRRDEELDNIHSIYVDQWDWEKVITKEERNETTLKKVVEKEEAIQPFDEVKDQLSQQLMAMKQQETYLSKVDELKKEYEVKINE